MAPIKLSGANFLQVKKRYIASHPKAEQWMLELWLRCSIKTTYYARIGSDKKINR